MSQSNLRLLFISNLYPPHDIGGYEKHCQEIAKGLRSKGHAVHILTSRFGPERKISELDVTRSLYLESNISHYNPLHFFLRRASEERQNLSVLNATISVFRPDIIVIWGMWNLSRNIPYAAEASGIPLAYWLGDLWPMTPDIHIQYWSELAKQSDTKILLQPAAKMATRLLKREGYPPVLKYTSTACGSQYLKSKLSAVLPIFRASELIMCGVDLVPYANLAPHHHVRNSLNPRLLYLGRVDRNKGVLTIAEAMAELAKTNPQMHPELTIAGPGTVEYMVTLRNRIQALGVMDRVSFTGTLPKEQLPLLFEQHDILIVPSVWEEPFGRVIVEGMAAGLVVMGTATGGSAEILIHGVNCMVFPPEDAGALANHILQICNTPQLYLQLAREGNKTSTQFNLKTMIDEFERFLLTIPLSR